MAKKKGKKGKGKTNKLKGGLTNREREIFLLTISELEHKIAWRKHLCGIIEEDLKIYREKLELQDADKADTVNILEEAIQEQRTLYGKIQGTLPDAQNSKMQAEERHARELASKLLQMNKEKLSHDVKLNNLRKKLKSLENYNPEEIEEKIKEMQKQLDTENVDTKFHEESVQEKRRKEAFRKELQVILAKKAGSFQEEISGKLDKNFQRITEETRWWADTDSGLRIEIARLEAINEMKLTNLASSQKDLKQRKNISLNKSLKLQEAEAKNSEVVRQINELQHKLRSKAEYQNYLSILDGISEDLKQTVYTEENHLRASINSMKENESEINFLEEKLSNEILFGNQLTKFFEKAEKILTEEVKYSLIVTYNGPPEKKKLIEDLKCLFAEATKFIYDRKDKSML